MKPSRDASEQIARELAAVEREITQLHAKLRVLEAQRDRLRTAQSVLLEMTGESPEQSGQPSSTGEEHPVQH